MYLASALLFWRAENLLKEATAATAPTASAAAANAAAAALRAARPADAAADAPLPQLGDAELRQQLQEELAAAPRLSSARGAEVSGGDGDAAPLPAHDGDVVVVVAAVPEEAPRALAHTGAARE